MQLTVNGEAITLERPLSVVELMARLGVEGSKIAVERNLEIVPRSAFAETVLSEGDQVEIVQFMGGG